MEEAWSCSHTVECPVTPEFAWRFWTTVSNWHIDSDVESVELESEFVAGSRGATISRSMGRVAWQILTVDEGRSATIEIPGEGAWFRTHWTFEPTDGRTRITQRMSLGGDAAGPMAAAAGPMMEQGIGAGMAKLCDAMAAAAAERHSFTGVWQLDAETLDYQHGRPGRRAVYKIEEQNGEFRFTLDADDADGKAMHHVYGGHLDGAVVPVTGTPFALVLQRPAPHVIESILQQEGKVIDRWTRTMQPDGQTILITQHGFRPDGTPFRNRGTYRRVG